jgi:hypothetical protein
VAEAQQDPLLNLAVNALIIDDQQISVGTVGLSANEQRVLLSYVYREKRTS